MSKGEFFILSMMCFILAIMVNNSTARYICTSFGVALCVLGILTP